MLEKERPKKGSPLKRDDEVLKKAVQRREDWIYTVKWWMLIKCIARFDQIVNKLFIFSQLVNQEGIYTVSGFSQGSRDCLVGSQ